MDCSVIQMDLVAYHLGAIDDGARERVEAHLVECASCVRAYVTLKRHAEAGSAKPSDAARAKLRAAVSEEFETSARARVRRFLARPIPLYKGLAAAAAVAIAIGAAAPIIARMTTNQGPEPIAGGERVDSARAHPESLSFY
jgi:anti-sigma factor RsiW